MFQWLKNKWLQFEAWFNSKLPGLKIKLISGAGMVGSAALVIQEYIRGLPLEQYITAKSILITNVVLFTLVYWLRRINENNE